MDSELKELKSVLRSIVVSSPSQVDVRSLLRDYRNMVGTPIPLAKYGFKDPLAFLKERCNDCFLFQGLPSNPVLTLIVPDHLKHIDQFVRKQKTSGAAKVKGKRRSVCETFVKPQIHQDNTNLVCSTFNRTSVRPSNTQPATKPPDINNKQTTNSNDNPTDSIRNICNSVTKSTSKIYNSSINNSCKDVTIPTNKMNTNSKGATEYQQYNKSLQHLKPVNENENPNARVENGYLGNVQNFFKKRLPAYNSLQCLDNEVCSDLDKASSKDDNDSGRQTSSSQNSTKRAQLEELKCEIHELIKEYKGGIWCTDLMRLYRERYKRELSFDRFGHNNLNSLLRDMQELVSFSTEGGGLRLKDASCGGGGGGGPRGRAPAAPPAPRPLAALRARPVDPDDALPGIDFEPDVFPADCMHFMESIPPLSLADVTAGAMLEVLVGEVYSPSHFWLQRLGDSYNVALDRLMDEMSEYYNHGEGKNRVLAPGAVRVGHYCSSVYDNDWHRSLIVKVIDADTVKVRHVDYGTVESVAAAALRPLGRAWGALPAQALRARLAGLRPGAGGRRWPRAAAAHFLHLVRDTRLVANVCALHPQEDTIETFLINTSGPDDVCITSEMIRSGHADPRPDSALRTAECYLYPRFEVLESGDTPNFAEIHRYLADGISLEYVEAYRRHVPAVLPEPSSPPSPPPPLPPPSPPPPVDLINCLPGLRLDSPSRDASTLSLSHFPAPMASPPPLPKSPTPPASVVMSSLTPPVVSPTILTPPPIASNITTPATSSDILTSSLNIAPTSTSTSSITLKSTSNVAPTSTSNVTPTSASNVAPTPTSNVAPPPKSNFAFTSASTAFPANCTRVGHPSASRPPPAQWVGPPPPPQWLRGPPPWAGEGQGEVRLSVQECKMYSLLCSLDPEAAHCYMASALRRAHSTPAGRPPCPLPRPPRPLNPHAPEFRVSFPAAYGVAPAPPRTPHPPPFMRPPPGF